MAAMSSGFDGSKTVCRAGSGGWAMVTGGEGQRLSTLSAAASTKCSRCWSPVADGLAEDTKSGQSAAYGFPISNAEGVAVGMPFHHQDFVGHSPVRISA